MGTAGPRSLSCASATHRVFGRFVPRSLSPPIRPQLLSAFTPIVIPSSCPDSLESEHRLIAAQQVLRETEEHAHIGSFVRVLKAVEVNKNRIPSDLHIGRAFK